MTSTEKRNLEMLEQVKELVVEKDDKFNFKCTGCNGHCYSVTKIGIYDAYRIADSLMIDNVYDFVTRHCAPERNASGMINMYTKLLGYAKSCNFLNTFRPDNKAKCVLKEKDKPTTCMLYPLGVLSEINKNTNEIRLKLINYNKDSPCCNTAEEVDALSYYEKIESFEQEYKASMDLMSIPIHLIDMAKFAIFDDSNNIGKRICKAYTDNVLYKSYRLTSCRPFLDQYADLYEDITKNTNMFLEMATNIYKEETGVSGFSLAREIQDDK